MGDASRSAALALLALGLLAADATDSVALPDPGGDAWQPIRFRGVARPTHYAPPETGGPGTRAEADCGASALVLPLADLDLARTPTLRWHWRVLLPLDVADERRREGDDFAARVTVMFGFEPEHASLATRIRHALGERLFGEPLPGSALSFVWTSHIAPGTLWTSPYTPETRMIAQARGAATGWRSEAVDLVAAYRRAFRRPPPAAHAIGIMTDADDTCQRAAAEYRDFRLTAEAA